MAEQNFAKKNTAEQHPAKRNTAEQPPAKGNTAEQPPAKGNTAEQKPAEKTSAEKGHPDYRLEKELLARGFSCVCGIDEAGRGPLAGPVFAAAVILSPDCSIPGLNDSKKLSPKKREALYQLILDKAVACSVASSSEREIDEYNILEATFLAMYEQYEAFDELE
ncbi:MAG TPA: hypothetical protein PLS28_05310, partial [Clostridiales bacterium]|nr:hypothetical protein [Clostridiales bacterium]